MTVKNKIAFGIATFFGSGLAPLAPGTIGSLATIPLAFVLAYYFGIYGIAIGCVVCFIIGTWAISIVLKTSKHDPSFVVIDEVVGQLLTFLPLADELQYNAHATILYLLGFMLFRLFDITKPQPAKWADKKVRNAWGVMLDDVFAGIYAAVILYVINLWIYA
ncbi:MAG: phosphatidylglycerophosphatase A [Alphaproteobacteria bacterium]|nr:phosphatidylglycerophosphatase A [Alphaproteobacteria bacterium]